MDGWVPVKQNIYTATRSNGSPGYKVKLTEVKLEGYGKVVLKSPLTGKRHWFHAKESLFKQFEACAFDCTEPHLII
jgi:hypothetical protein